MADSTMHFSIASNPLAQHAAQLLPSGTTLLVAGGVRSGGFVTSAERYTP